MILLFLIIKELKKHVLMHLNIYLTNCINKRFSYFEQRKHEKLLEISKSQFLELYW